MTQKPSDNKHLRWYTQGVTPLTLDKTRLIHAMYPKTYRTTRHRTARKRTAPQESSKKVRQWFRTLTAIQPTFL